MVLPYGFCFDINNLSSLTRVLPEVTTAIQILPALEEQAKQQLSSAYNILVISLFHVCKQARNKTWYIDFIYQIGKQFVMNRELRGERNVQLY